LAIQLTQNLVQNQRPRSSPARLEAAYLCNSALICNTGQAEINPPVTDLCTPTLITTSKPAEFALLAHRQWHLIQLRPVCGSREASPMSFEVKSCEVLYYGPHRAIPGRVTGVIRVKIHERFMGTETDYALDLKVRAQTGFRPSGEVRTALLAHAAHQLNKLKSRHDQPAANAVQPAIAAE
jgi:hypothetical protein